LEGCVIIVTELFTVKVAAFVNRLLTQSPFKAARYWFAFIAGVTEVKFKVEAFAPGILVKLVPPLVLTCHW
jgi:hypothetical protein